MTGVQRDSSSVFFKEFKRIFFWEYFHRIWGRLIGLTFIIPLIFFWFKNIISSKEKKFFSVLFFLGCFQAFVGWFMVKSGLVDMAIAQHPAEIGYMGVMVAFGHVTGNPVPVSVGTGFTVMTADNIDDPNISKYVYSD